MVLSGMLAGWRIECLALRIGAPIPVGVLPLIGALFGAYMVVWRLWY